MLPSFKKQAKGKEYQGMHQEQLLPLMNLINALPLSLSSQQFKVIIK